MGITDQCSAHNNEYMRDNGSYVYYDFDNDGAKDFWLTVFLENFSAAITAWTYYGGKIKMESL